MIQHQKLMTLTRKIFEKKGVAPEDAEIVARSLVEANLRGTASHGVLRVVNYISRIDQGGTNPRSNIRVVRETPVSAVLYGDNGLGALVAHRAVQIARQKAGESGIACVVARGSNHYGTASYWATMLAGNDMIGFSCSNVEQLIVPPNGKDKAIGNNPFATVIPAGKRRPICADMATSEIALGRILDYRLKNQALQPGWAVDAEGQPTTDPFQAANLLPFGAHKGYSIAVILEALCSLLAGGKFGGAINSMYGDPDKANELSHCFVAIRIDLFRPLEEFHRDVDAFIDSLHDTPAIAGRSVLLPGEIELDNKENNLKTGVALPDNLIRELTEIATALGIEHAAGYLC